VKDMVEVRWMCPHLSKPTKIGSASSVVIGLLSWWGRLRARTVSRLEEGMY